MDNRAALEKWNEVLKIIGEFNGTAVVERFFRNISNIAYSEETETLTVYANLFHRMLIEDDYKEAFIDAVKHVFGENTRLELEDKSEPDKNGLSSSQNKTKENNFALREPDPRYHTASYIRKHEEMLRIRHMIREMPEFFFGENKYAELFFRVMANFANCAEVVGLSKHISVTRNGNLIEICDCEGFVFHLSILSNEMKLFEKSDYFSYTVPGFRRSSRYSPCPFYFIGSRAFNLEKCYYINSSLYLTMFMLVCLSPLVDFENVGDGRSEKISYRDGKSLWDYAEKSETDKKNGAYITFEAWDELENEDICRVLERIALLVSGLRLSFTDTGKDEKVSYCYKNAGEFLATRDSFNHPCYSGTVNALGQDRYNELHYNARVELTFNFTLSKPTAITYYNYSLLEKDNLFAEKLYETLTEKLSGRLAKELKRPLKVWDVKKFTSLVLNIRTDGDFTKWTPERKDVGRKQMINDIIEDVAAKAFREWFGPERENILKLVLEYFLQEDINILDELFPDGMK